MRIHTSRYHSFAAALILGALVAAGCGDDPVPDETDVAEEPLEDSEPDTKRPPRSAEPARPKPATPPGGAAPIPTVVPPQPIKPVPEPELPPEQGDLDLEQALARMETLYPQVLARPDAMRWRENPDSAEGLQQAKTYAEARRRWQSDVKEIVLLSRRYVRATESTEGGAPVARYYEGFGRLELAQLVGRNEGATQRDKAVTALEAYMDATREGEGYHADAANLLVRAYAFTVPLAPERAEKARKLLPAVVRMLSAEGRRDEAVVSMSYVCKPLLKRGREEGDVAALDRLAELAEELDFETADYGPTTRTFVAMARATRVRPGATLDELPEGVKDVDGKALALADLRGKNVVLHFFKTDLSERTREVEAHLAPLYGTYHDKGLEMIGVSIDWEMTPEFLERRKRAWERDEMDMSKLRDGKLESVRDWAETHGIVWRWYWDGKWLGNRIADHYGVPLNQAWSILIDGEGAIVWAGPPFKLKEQVEKQMGG